MDKDAADVIANAIRDAGQDIESGSGGAGYFELTDEQWEMLPRAICAAGEMIANNMALLSACEVADDGGQAGLVDGFFAIARSLDRVAEAIEGKG